MTTIGQRYDAVDFIDCRKLLEELAEIGAVAFPLVFECAVDYFPIRSQMKYCYLNKIRHDDTLRALARGLWPTLVRPLDKLLLANYLHRFGDVSIALSYMLGVFRETMTFEYGWEEYVQESLGSAFLSFQSSLDIDPDDWYFVFKQFSDQGHFLTRVLSVYGLAYCSNIRCFQIIRDMVDELYVIDIDELRKILNSDRSKMQRIVRAKLTQILELRRPHARI